MPYLNMGTGDDGNITFTVDTNLNNTDMPVHAVTSIGTNYVDLDSTSGLSVDDEVLLINTRGLQVGTEGPAGHHETFTIAAINGLKVTFGSEKQLFYGDGGTTDDNIVNQPVQLQRVPNYNNVTINAGVSVYPGETGRDNTPGGVLFMRVLGTLTINGTLHADGRGGDGGFRYPDNPHGLGVGRGVAGYNGQGGVYAVAGGKPTWGGVINTNIYGDQEITDLHIGSGGGRGDDGGNPTAQNAGDGGGAVYVHATTLTIGGTGSVLCKGDNGAGYGGQGGGGGSGGSIKLIVGTYNQSGTLTAEGGTAVTNGGPGAVGRIAVYANVFNDTPSSTPSAYTAEATLPFFIAGSISEDAIIRIYDSAAGALIATTSGTNGSYSIVAPGLGPYDVMGRPHDENTGALIYKDIVPQQH